MPDAVDKQRNVCIGEQGFAVAADLGEVVR
jgi:hypothetical protein